MLVKACPDLEDRRAGAYEGRSFGDPDDGSGSLCSWGGERYFELLIETVPDDALEV